MEELTLQLPNYQLVARCGADLEDQACALLQRIADFRDPEASDGLLFEFGWVPLKLAARDDRLYVCEPDFHHDPFRAHVFSVDVTLRVLAAQLGLARSLNLDPATPRFDQKVVVERGVLSVERLLMRRLPPDRPDDSGWTIEEINTEYDGEKAWEAAYISDIAVRRMPIMAAMMLPYGFTCVFDGPLIDMILDDQQQVIWREKAEVTT